MGGFYHEVPQNYLKQSPIVHLTKDDPPIAIICGEYDKPSTRANAFRKKASQLGVPTKLTEISGAPHGLLKSSKHRVIAINALDNFLKSHLGKRTKTQSRELQGSFIPSSFFHYNHHLKIADQ